VNSASGDQLIGQLEEINRNDPVPAGTISLAAASRRIGGRLKPWASIVDAMLDGSLPFWRRTKGRMAYSVAVWPGDLGHFMTVEDDSSGVPAASLVSKTDADEILNCTIRQLQAIEQRGLLRFQRVDKGLATGIAATLTLASQVMSCAEFALRSGSTPRRASYRLRQLNIPRIAFGWDRTVIERSGLLG